MNFKKSVGFTLIELLVVVLIIGVLAAMALPQYRVAVAKARFAQLQAFGDAIYKAEQLFYMTNGRYSNNFNNLTLEIPGRITEDGRAVVNRNYHCSIRVGEMDDGKNYSEYSCAYKGGFLDGDVPVYIRYLNSRYRTACRTYLPDTGSVPTRVCLTLSEQEEPSDCNESFGYCQYPMP